MMRTLKFKLGVAALATLFALTACGGPVPATDSANDLLHFNQDGTFKIMSISDIQDGADVSPYAIKLITMALDAESPDMVVLNGDNILDWSPSLLASGANVKKSIDTFTAPIVARNIPFAVVFGNHDYTVPMNKPAQWAYYQSIPGALGAMNQIGDRVGNYNVTVQNTSGQPALNLWFFDSGGSTLSALGTDMLPAQLDWYKTTADQIKQQNGGSAVPSVVFQHIPVPQIYDLLKQVDKSTPGAVQGSGVNSGNYYLLDDATISDGTLGEGPCPLEQGQAEFEAWLQQGDVMAAVFGHDHANSFHGTVQGIQLMYDSSVGFDAYGNGYLHGVRVLEFNQDDVTAFTTHMITWKDLTDETIPADLMYDGAFAHGAMYGYFVVAGVIVLGVVALIVLGVIKVRKRIKNRH